MTSIMSKMRVLLMIILPIKCLGENRSQRLPELWRSDLDDEYPVMKMKILMMMRKMMIYLGEQVSARSQGGQLLPLSKPKAGTACLARSLNMEIILSIFTQTTFSQPNMHSDHSHSAHIHSAHIH